MTRHLLFLLIMLLTVSACTVTPDGPQHAVNLSAQLQQVAKVQQWGCFAVQVLAMEPAAAAALVTAGGQAVKQACPDAEVIVQYAASADLGDSY